MTTRALVPVELLEARVEEYRLELAKRDMEIVVYRETLEQHGIAPPNLEGAELLSMWRDCRAVITTASRFVTNLGTAKELLADWTPTNGGTHMTRATTDPEPEPTPEPEPENGDEE